MAANAITFKVTSLMTRYIKWRTNHNDNKIHFRVIDEYGNTIGKASITAEQLYTYVLSNNEIQVKK